MRSKNLSVVVTAALLALVLAVGSALAQASVSVKADIPLELVFGTAKLPAK